MNQLNKRQGFTLIELMLSMSFVAVLLLTIAMTVIQMSTIYNRGMTIKEVNQAARDTADDLRRTVQATSVFDISTSGADTTDYVTLRTPGGVIMGGRLCLGSFSYVWNTADGIAQGSDSLVAKYVTNPSGALGGESINLVKVPDVGKIYCSKSGTGALAYPNIQYADRASAIELLKPGDRTIRVLQFAVSTTAAANDVTSGQRLYSFLYRLGTGETSAMNPEQTACLAPDQQNSNLTYCNIQQFSIVLRAGNTVN